ncbi:MAG: TAXI family TRAP transporter solute-binding subunit, partial [Spirochaetia bacterium]|nr:TAXI family TRAP transporter solute-binding subunit [Spirochaetia bacterium]
MKNTWVICLIISAILLFASCEEEIKKPSLGRRDFLFIKSHNTGSYYSAGSAWARLITSNTDFIGVNSTSPSTDNEKIEMLSSNKAQAAFLKGPEANIAYHGDPVYWKQPQPIRAMFALWPAVYNLITYRDSGIKKIEDLQGKRIAIYSEKAVNGDILEYLLSLYNINQENTVIYRVRESIGIRMLMRREVDCIWYNLGYEESSLKHPTASDIDTIPSGDSFIQIAIEPDKNFREFLKINPYFYLSIFGSEIGLSDTTQLMTSSFSACAEDMTEEVAKTLTRLWWENMTFVKQYVTG